MKKTVYRFLCMALTLCMLCTMTVITASAAENAEVTVVYGTAYQMPSTVGAVTDIKWDGSVDATTFGTQTITGTGTGGSVTLTANIAAPKVVYKNNFDSYPTGAGTSFYESADKFLKLYADAGVYGNTIVEETDGNKYFKAGPSTVMSMYSVLRPQGTMNGKVAMRFRFRGVDLKGEWKDILKMYIRDQDGNGIGEIRFQGGSDGDPGTDVQKTRYLYARYSSDGSTWNGGTCLASNFNNGDTDWVNVTLVVDQTAGTYSLYAENIVLFENVRFKGTTADNYTPNSKIASQLCFTCRGMSGEGYMCVDDFMYLDLNEASLSYPQSNATVTQATVNATVGEAYALPATVGGINVKWNQATVDTSKIGRRVVAGKNDFSQDVTLKVNVGTSLVYSDTAESYATTKTTGFHIEAADINSGAVKVADDDGNSVISFDITSATSAYETGAYYNKGNGGIANKVTFSCRVKFTELLEHESSSGYYFPMKMRFNDDSSRILNDINFIWYGYSNNMYVRPSNSSYNINWDKGGNSGIGRNSNDTDWADIKAVIDIENDSFKVYVNGSLIIEDEILNSSATNLAYVGFACRQTGSKLLADDFKWYDDANMKFPTGTMPTGAINTKVGLGASAEKAEVTLAMSDGSAMEFPVTYTVDTSKPGYKSAVGTVDGFNAETVLINAKVLSYEPVDFVFETSDGAASIEPANGGKLKSLGVKRYTASSDDAVIMIAIYDNDVLKTVKPADISGVKLGETQTIDLNIALPSDVSKLDIRTFVLDGKDTLKPIDLSEYWVPAKKKTVIYLAGDSTTENVPAENGGDYYYPRTGWGEKLSNYIDSDKYVVDNRGKSGRSTKSYIDEGRLDDILKDISVGDYLFINFGHNDQATNDPARGTTIEEYKTNLRTYINRTRAKGANPVLVTSVPRLVYKVNGQEVWGHNYTGTAPLKDYYGYENLKDRTDAMKDVAAEMHVPYLDLNMLMADHIRNLSVEDAKDIYMILSHNDSRFINDPRFAVSKFNSSGNNYDSIYASNNDHDTTHLNYYGADLCASFVAKEIEEKIPSLAAALTDYEVSKPAGW